MRNKLVISAVLGVALATSCVKMSTDDTHRAISFMPVAEKATKAILTGTTYPTTETFKVSAFHNGQAYFENQEAAYNSTLALWATGTDQYWPLSGSITFNAFSPASAGLTIGANGVSVTGYTVTTTEQMSTDLLYATETVADCSSHPASVPLTFSHALTQVVFRVKAAGYYSNNSRTVSLALTSLSLSGIKSVGDFTSANGWENQRSERNYTLSNSSTTLTYDGQNMPETIDICSYLFIPQELGANAALNVGYDVVQTVNQTDYTLANAPVSIHLGGTITQWEPGKKYIYTLNIGMDNVITFTVTAVGWQSESDNIIVEES